MGDVDEEACLAVVPAKDAPGMAPSVCPTMGAAIYMDDGPGYAISTDDVVAAPGCAMSTEDTSGVASPVCPTTDVPTYADNGSGHAISTYDVTASPGHAMPTMGAPDVPSTACPPIDAVIDCASLVDPMIAPTTLQPTCGTAPDGS